MAIVDPFNAGQRGPAGADGADGADGAVSYISATYTSSGDIATNGGTQDHAAATLPSRGVIVGATMSKTAGDSTNMSALLYDGDPGSGGVLICALFGGAFSGYDFSSGAKNGPQINAGGSDVSLCVPYASATPYVRFVNSDPLNTCQASLTLWVQEVVA